ncbi:MAG: hypothetical protein ACW98I_11360 [Candidatus Hodarchaeales archaeon]|jgi:hypothetical protein
MQGNLKDLDEEIVWKSTELMEAALNLSVYRYTLAFSLGNLILMVLLTGSIILLQMVITSIWPLILGWFVLTLLAVGIHLKVFGNILKRVEPMQYEAPIWGISYILIFFLGYTVNTLIGTVISPQVLWFPLLGLANLIIGVTTERFHYKKQELYSQPILIFSIFLLIATPFLLILIALIPDLDDNYLTPALALILASLSTSYSIYLAEKKVVKI